MAVIEVPAFATGDPASADDGREAERQRQDDCYASDQVSVSTASSIRGMLSMALRRL